MGSNDEIKDLFGSDYELAEAVEELEMEFSGFETARKPQAKKTPSEENAIALMLPEQQENFHQLVEEARKIRSIPREKRSLRDKERLRRKLKEIAKILIKEMVGYGRLTTGIKEEATKKTRELTTPSTPQENTPNPHAQRFEAAAQAALVRRPGGREAYINALSEKIGRELKLQTEKVREEIIAAMKKRTGE